jgi:hypothetical protein
MKAFFEFWLGHIFNKTYRHTWKSSMGEYYISVEYIKKCMFCEMEVVI